MVTPMPHYPYLTTLEASKTPRTCHILLSIHRKRFCHARLRVDIMDIQVWMVLKLQTWLQASRLKVRHG
jgi:hypothetical protein